MEKDIKKIYLEDLQKFLYGFRECDFDVSVDKVQNENALKLAFIGDTIFDLWTRNYLFLINKNKMKMNDIHKKNSDLVCAKSQANIVESLINDNFLTEEEVSIYKHGRNANSKTRSKNSSIIDYKKATGFECLIGYLYYSKKIDRMIEIFNKAFDYI